MSLAEQIRAIERRLGHENASIIAKHDRFEAIPTGWPEVDAALGGGLAGGALHEWFGVDDSAPPPPKEAPRRRAGETASASWGRFPGQAPHNTFRETWAPPLCLFVHLARQALEAGRSPFWIVWVGARCFPYPAVLTRLDDNDLGLLARSLFVAPRDVNTRLWAIDHFTLVHADAMSHILGAPIDQLEEMAAGGKPLYLTVGSSRRYCVEEVIAYVLEHELPFPPKAGYGTPDEAWQWAAKAQFRIQGQPTAPSRLAWEIWLWARCSRVGERQLLWYDLRRASGGASSRYRQPPALRSLRAV